MCNGATWLHGGSRAARLFILPRTAATTTAGTTARAGSGQLAASVHFRSRQPTASVTNTSSATRDSSWDAATAVADP